MGKDAALKRWYDLEDSAIAALEAGNTEQARRDAEEMLEGAKGRERDWNYGNAIHFGHIITGCIALKAGDVDKANEHLLAAGKTPGSPQLDSFGPDLTLAQELLDRGQGEAVAEYLRLVSRFWKGWAPLESWTKAIEQGGRPRLTGGSPLLRVHVWWQGLPAQGAATQPHSQAP